MADHQTSPRNMHDLSPALAEILRRDPALQKRLNQDPVALVHPGDGMYSGNDAYYLQTGISALNQILAALVAAERRVPDVASVMDYACGYGRVTRWLQAAFSHADLYAGDLDPKAVAAVDALTRATTVELCKALSRPLPRQFDLIWVGSLITHLSERSVYSLLRFMSSQLMNSGVLVVTAHGEYVAERIRSRKKPYNLAEEDLDALIKKFDEDGFAFAAYPGQEDYGISISTPSKLAGMAAEVGLELVRFEKKGWVRHQDCFAFVRAGSA